MQAVHLMPGRGQLPDEGASDVYISGRLGRQEDLETSGAIKNPLTMSR